MKRSGMTFVVGGAVAIAIALGGCREEEQNRVLIFDKGTYAGKADTPPTEEAIRARRERISHQGGLGTTDLPGAAPSGQDVRPPSRAAAPPPTETLRDRGQHQKFN